jgi:hypothetical protein
MSILCKLQAQIDALQAAVDAWVDTDTDDQTLSIEGCELSISGGNTVELPLSPYPVYRLTDDPGVRVRKWETYTPHDLVANIFTGPTDPESGFPTESQAQTPDIDLIEPDFNTAGSADLFEAWAWVTLDQPGFLRDNNGNTGELGEVYIGLCCGTPVIQPGANNGSLADDTDGADRTLLDPVAVPAGTHFIYVRSSDFSANQGIDIEYSADGTSWANLTAAQVQASKPTVECQIIDGCEPVPEGWDLCVPELCAPVMSPASPGGGLDEAAVQALLPAPSTLVPIPDNEVDAAIRTGIVGTSLDYARADHNHPIRRQANPGDPVITVGGNLTMSQSIVLDRWSDEESYSWAFRCRVAQPAGTGWGWLTIPTIAGFQRVKLHGIGTYRSDSNAPQTDDGTGASTDGASPRGPVMAHEVHHWSSTQRLYASYFRRDEAITSMFVEFIVEVTRT